MSKGDSNSTAPAPVMSSRRFVVSATDSAKWPVKGPAPLPGSLLPRHRIVAYYGNPLSPRMGVLGRLPPAEMLARLEQVAADWADADTTTLIVPALHLIATVAQGRPGPGRKYRMQMTDSLIGAVADWAEERGWLIFLDVQIGHSNIHAELLPLVPFLSRPYVHLALDPEFAMKRGGIPGRRIGTMDASDVNYAIGLLAGLVTEHHLPPKVLVVHRFSQRMLTNHDQIRLDPKVQVVVDMDGFGAAWHKQAAYRSFVVPEPVQFTGFKLFYKNDRDARTLAPDFTPSCPAPVYQRLGCGDDGLMTPEQVLRLFPQPLYIQYQ